MPDSWVPDACTLPIAEQPLRVTEFDDLFRTAVLAVSRPDPTRLRLALTATPEVAATAAGLMTRETACCGFFTCTLTAAEGALSLELAVPAQHAAVLDAVQHKASTP